MTSSRNKGEPPTSQPPGLFERLDKLNEFDREPVTPDRLESRRHFAAVFAGEHVAGTEFVIGALFVSWGVGTRDLVLGLLIGNLLAVLAWTFICAPIAVETRLTLYWYLRRIAGPVVTTIYNVVNAILFCALAGAMITVSASAVRIPFGIPPQTEWYPTDLRFVVVAVAVGAVVVTISWVSGGWRSFRLIPGEDCLQFRRRKSNRFGEPFDQQGFVHAWGNPADQRPG